MTFTPHQIKKDQVDIDQNFMMTSDMLPDNYPTKIMLSIEPDGTTHSSISYNIIVTGLTEEVYFILRPSTASMHAQ